MKKIMTILSFLFFTSLAPHTSFAEELHVFIDNKPLHFQDEKPMIEDGRVLLPVRAVQESMGAKLKWNSNTEQIYSVKEKGNQKTSILYRIRSPYVYKQFFTKKNNEQLIEKIDVPAKLKNGRAYIPLRSATESFGYNVEWNASTNSVHIEANQTIEPKESDSQYKMVGDFFEVNETEKAIFFMTNQERVLKGLNPLMLDINLSKIARLKSKDMFDKSYFSHTSPTYGSPFEMMRQFDLDFVAAGENIAAGYPSAAGVTKGWMNSKGHRENILNKSFTRIGIGYFEADRDYKTYYTQLFSKEPQDK